MTKEEAIDLLDNLIGMIEDNHNSDYDTAFKMAIKALEQESVLDKIRTEIMQVAEYEKCYDEKWALGLRYAVKIIDKCKTESEKV